MSVIHNDYVASTVAVASIASPAWLPLMQSISTYAALLMPILGVALLGMQIWYRLFKNDRSDE